MFSSFVARCATRRGSAGVVRHSRRPASSSSSSSPAAGAAAAAAAQQQQPTTPLPASELEAFQRPSWSVQSFFAASSTGAAAEVDVARLAALSKLTLQEGDEAAVRSVLRAVSIVQEAGVEAASTVPPHSHTVQAMELRGDDVVPPMPVEVAVGNAATVVDGAFFAVPRVRPGEEI